MNRRVILDRYDNSRKYVMKPAAIALSIELTTTELASKGAYPLTNDILHTIENPAAIQKDRISNPEEP